MAERIDLRKELINSFSNLKQSLLDLNYIWEDIKKSNDELLSDFMEKSMTKEYPFSISFEDMLSYIVPWADKKMDELKVPLLQYIVDSVMDNLSNLPTEVKNLIISELSKK